MTKRKFSKSFLRTSGNIPVVASLIVLVAFIAGLLIGTLVTTKAIGGKTINRGSYVEGYNAAKNKLDASGMIPSFPGILSGQITAINGKEISFSVSLRNPLDDESLKTRVAVIDDSTKITLYHYKDSEQSAVDRGDAQKTLSDTQGKISSLQDKIDKCRSSAAEASSTNNSSNCDSLSQKYNDLLKKQTDAFKKMDMFDEVSNASLSDIKPGMQITVYGTAINTATTTENGSAPMPGGSDLTDISNQAKFNVSRIEVRETLSMTQSQPQAASSTGAPMEKK
jgi:hypothetical protein